MKAKHEEQENHIKRLSDLTCDTRNVIEKLKDEINAKNQDIEDAELEIKSYEEVSSSSFQIYTNYNYVNTQIF